MISVEELSYSMRNVVDEASREWSRRIERNLMRFTIVTAHLMYNKTFLNIYIYILMFIYIYIYNNLSTTFVRSKKQYFIEQRLQLINH